jgi:plastocyanin
MRINVSKHIARWLAVAALGATAAYAAKPVEVSVVIAGHRFEPASLSIPAGTPVVFRVVNKDATPEEFESGDLGFEKVIPGGAEANVWVAPMEPGHYTFFGEFNPDTAQGTVTVE